MLLNYDSYKLVCKIANTCTLLSVKLNVIQLMYL